MIDPETARQGARLLATAIGEIMEDAVPEALKPLWPTEKESRTRAAQLQSVGDDIAALANAMIILVRRGETGDR